MTRREVHRLVRKSHRYLGLILGIQFFLWTIGGVYFSWTNINEIRGDNLKKELPVLRLDSCLVPLSVVLENLKKLAPKPEVQSVQLVSLLGRNYYSLTYKEGLKPQTVLADAVTGNLRPTLSENEAVEVAKSRLKESADVIKVDYLTQTDPHHEYREKPLPAYAITFGGNVNTTVYVAASSGQSQTFRNKGWRVFDFFWMLHTMDYQGRDNSNNWVLRIFSLLGLFAILSGFVLYVVSYKKSKN